MFSEKYGYKEPKTIQYERVSNELRNSIWILLISCSAFVNYLIEKYEKLEEK